MDMIIDYDVKKINQVLGDFYNSVGIRIDLLKDDFTPISYSEHEAHRYCMAVQRCPKGKKGCNLSDQKILEKCRLNKKPEIHICHAGLVDIAVPILYDDIVIGYIIFGQMKTDTDFSDLKDYVSSLGLSQTEMEKYYSELSVFDSDKIQSISNIASMLVKHILLENMLKPALNDSIRLAVDYIDRNLESELSIKTISSSINVSKSVLYKNFHEKFNCTVSDYIKRRRIEKSIKLLERGNLTIEEISQKVGFSSASYYSKTFKKYMGIPPLKYRNKK